MQILKQAKISKIADARKITLENYHFYSISLSHHIKILKDYSRSHTWAEKSSWLYECILKKPEEQDQGSKLTFLPTCKILQVPLRSTR